MVNVDRKHFFDTYRAEYGPLIQRTVDAINFLLDSMEADTHIEDLRWAAYMLATVKRECDNTFRPIAEYRCGAGKNYGKKDPITGQVYYGRGYVQLTWRDNYAEMGRIFDLDLLHNPNMALNPEVAYRIMSYGMRRGSFTGKALFHYINATECDYVNARRIINGTDCAEMIAAYARVFEAALRPA